MAERLPAPEARLTTVSVMCEPTSVSIGKSAHFTLAEYGNTFVNVDGGEMCSQ